MPDYDEEAIAAVADEIKRYLEARPNAADTVEGISHWWLTRQRFEKATEIAQWAIEYQGHARARHAREHPSS